MAEKIKVVIVEDENDIREGYCFLINKSREFSCIGFGSGEEAISYLKQNEAHIVLMDVNLPGATGIECTSVIKDSFPQILLLMFTIYENNDNVFKALEAGANGYILKQSPPEELLAALTELINGGAPMSGSIARMVVASFSKNNKARYSHQLTAREEEVLKYLSEGYRYKDIAGKIFISVSTVRSHIYNIYEKLHVHNRTEAINKFNRGK